MNRQTLGLHLADPKWEKDILSPQIFQKIINIWNKCPGSTKFLKKKWVERYAFSGRLNTYDLTKLQEKIKNKHKANEKGLVKDGYYVIDKWLQIATRKEQGAQRAKEHRQHQQALVPAILKDNEHLEITQKSCKQIFTPHQADGAESQERTREQRNITGVPSPPPPPYASPGTTNLYPDIPETQNGDGPSSAPLFQPKMITRSALSSLGQQYYWPTKMGLETVLTGPIAPPTPHASPLPPPPPDNTRLQTPVTSPSWFQDHLKKGKMILQKATHLLIKPQRKQLSPPLLLHSICPQTNCQLTSYMRCNSNHQTMKNDYG